MVIDKAIVFCIVCKWGPLIWYAASPTKKRNPKPRRQQHHCDCETTRLPPGQQPRGVST